MPQVIEIKAKYYEDGMHKIIDDWAEKNNTTRHHAAGHIISAGVGLKVKVFFNGSDIIVHLPMLYVKKLKKNGASDAVILKHYIVTGLARITNLI